MADPLAPCNGASSGAEEQAPARLAADLAVASPSAASPFLDALALLLTPAGDTEPSEMLDELSFELWEPTLAHLEANPVAARRLLEGIATVGNAREVLLMVQGALSVHRSPRHCLLLVQLLLPVLPRLKRRRAELLSSCFAALSQHALGQWARLASEAEEDSAEAGAMRQLLPALLRCAQVSTLAHSAWPPPLSPLEASSALPPPPPPPPPQSGFDDSMLAVTYFALLILERSVADADAATQTASLEVLAWAQAPLSTLSPGGAPLPLAEASHADASTHEVDEEGADARLARSSEVGRALYLHSVCCGSPAPDVEASSVDGGAATTEAGANSKNSVASHAERLRASLDQLRAPVRLGLLARVSVTLLHDGRPSLARRGLELLSWAMTRCEGGQQAEDTVARSVLREAADALLSRMTCCPVQSDRSAAYKTWLRLLDLWPQAERPALLRALLRECRHASVAALLVHRLKEEFLRTRERGATEEGDARADEGPAQLLTVVTELLAPRFNLPEGLDALLATLNLLRFLLTDVAAARHELRQLRHAIDGEGGASSDAGCYGNGAIPEVASMAAAETPSDAETARQTALRERAVALPDATIAALRRNQLAFLDRELRILMDAEWAAAKSMENDGSARSSEAVDVMTRFTQLQVALDVLQRADALCKEHSA